MLGFFHNYLELTPLGDPDTAGERGLTHTITNGQTTWEVVQVNFSCADCFSHGRRCLIAANALCVKCVPCTTIRHKVKGLPQECPLLSLDRNRDYTKLTRDEAAQIQCMLLSEKPLPGQYVGHQPVVNSVIVARNTRLTLPPEAPVLTLNDAWKLQMHRAPPGSTMPVIRSSMPPTSASPTPTPAPALASQTQHSDQSFDQRHLELGLRPRSSKAPAQKSSTVPLVRDPARGSPSPMQAPDGGRQAAGRIENDTRARGSPIAVNMLTPVPTSASTATRTAGHDDVEEILIKPKPDHDLMTGTSLQQHADTKPLIDPSKEDVKSTTIFSASATPFEPCLVPQNPGGLTSGGRKDDKVPGSTVVTNTTTVSWRTRDGGTVSYTTEKVTTFTGDGDGSGAEAVRTGERRALAPSVKDEVDVKRPKTDVN